MIVALTVVALTIGALRRTRGDAAILLNTRLRMVTGPIVEKRRGPPH